MRLIVLTIVLCGLTPNSALCVDFEQHVAPVLIRRCLECHKGSDPSGSLSLETADGLSKGGDSGPVIDARQHQNSLLLQRVSSGEMPPAVKGVAQPLPADEQKILQQWVAAGAPWPAGRR